MNAKLNDLEDRLSRLQLGPYGPLVAVGNILQDVIGELKVIDERLSAAEEFPRQHVNDYHASEA